MESETIADILREMREQANSWWNKKVPNFLELHDHWMITADRIEAAAKATVFTDNSEVLHNAIAENERLRAALKPVLEFDEDAHHKTLNALRAVREAQRIYKEGGVNHVRC